MVEKLDTYLNLNGTPILRRCQNCKFWNGITEKTNEPNRNLGYCKFRPLYFSYTLQKSVFAMTKDFYLCEEHNFKNEEFLAEQGRKVSILEALRKKE
jgi:hypothetical protein